jgi:hypothetical protein
LSLARPSASLLTALSSGLWFDAPCLLTIPSEAEGLTIDLSFLFLKLRLARIRGLRAICILRLKISLERNRCIVPAGSFHLPFPERLIVLAVHSSFRLT